MKIVFRDLARLRRIDQFIRDTGFVATRKNIGNELGMSVRSVSYLLDAMEELGAPLTIDGHYSTGWVYFAPWDFWAAVQSLVEESL